MPETDDGSITLFVDDFSHPPNTLPFHPKSQMDQEGNWGLVKSRKLDCYSNYLNWYTISFEHINYFVKFISMTSDKRLSKVHFFQSPNNIKISRKGIQIKISIIGKLDKMDLWEPFISAHANELNKIFHVFKTYHLSIKIFQLLQQSITHPNAYVITVKLFQKEFV
jgi:hypothetical protein